MEKDEKKIPFPQANDFEKVIKILNVEEEEKIQDKKYLSIQLDMITDRQVQYYISACMYLGLLNGEKKFTKIAHKLRKMNSSEQTIELARLIVADSIFGKIYFSQKLYNLKMTTEDIADVMKDCNIDFEIEAMYKRRAQTVSSWVLWIEKELG